MSLPPPAPRRHLHTRKIVCEGFERDDGLFDIEARIVDTKTYAFDEPFRGRREAGDPVHDMMLRLTVDPQMVVRDIAVTTLSAPYPACTTVAGAFRTLVGAKIGGGWRRAVNEAVGGTKGCTHLRELLMPAATVVFQTLGGGPRADTLREEAAQSTKKPYFIDGCKAWSGEGEVVKKLFPLHYRGK